MTGEPAQPARAQRARHAPPGFDTGGRIRNLSDFMNLELDTRVRMLEEMTPLECAQLFHDWAFWARPEQAPPAGDWIIWLILAGRGAGKTRAGACWVQHRVEAGIMKLGCLIAPTMADIRDVMVDGPSGLLAVAPPWCRPAAPTSPGPRSIRLDASRRNHRPTWCRCSPRGRARAFRRSGRPRGPRWARKRGASKARIPAGTMVERPPAARRARRP